MNFIVKTEFCTSSFVHLFCFHDIIPVDQKLHHPGTGRLYFHWYFTWIVIRSSTLLFLLEMNVWWDTAIFLINTVLTPSRFSCSQVRHFNVDFLLFSVTTCHSFFHSCLEYTRQEEVEGRVPAWNFFQFPFLSHQNHLLENSFSPLQTKMFFLYQDYVREWEEVQCISSIFLMAMA